MRRRKQKYQNPAERLLERYELLEEMLIKTSGHLLLLRKIRGKPSEPIDIDLLDVKDEVDASINWLIRKIDRKLRLLAESKKYTYHLTK